MSEAKFQAKVIKALECRGWTVIKNIKVNKNGWPDLSAYKAGYPPLFIEVKGLTTSVTRLQKYRHDEMRKAGLKVRIIRERHQ